jgi:hypothetical protein
MARGPPFKPEDIRRNITIPIGICLILHYSITPLFI